MKHLLIFSCTKAFCNPVELFGISDQFKEPQIISKFMQSPIPQAALEWMKARETDIRLAYNNAGRFWAK